MYVHRQLYTGTHTHTQGGLITMLVDEPIKARATGTTVQPEHYRVLGWIPFRLHEIVIQFLLINGNIPVRACGERERWENQKDPYIQTQNSTQETHKI